LEIILAISAICLWIVVLFNLFLTFALIRRFNSKDNSNSNSNSETKRKIIDLKVGDHAPDFTAETLNGETVTLTSFAGYKTVFIFISTHCEPCEKLLPHIKPLKDKAISAGVKLVLVSAAEVEAARAYAEEEAINLPVLVAPRNTNTFIKDYKVNATPAFCFITAQGSIYKAGAPYLEGETWKDFNDFLSERPDFVVAEGGEAEEIGLR
jgi:peroxiredoxin